MRVPINNINDNRIISIFKSEFRIINFDRNPNVGGIPASDIINIIIKIFSLFISMFCSVKEYVNKVDFMEKLINMGRMMIL